MSRGAMYAKMAGVFVVCCLGGPALMYYVTPSEGELFKRFNPDLQKRNLENRDRRTKEYQDFSAKMIEYSKSDKPIWEAAADAQTKARAEYMQKQADEAAMAARMKEELRASVQAAAGSGGGR